MLLELGDPTAPMGCLLFLSNERGVGYHFTPALVAPHLEEAAQAVLHTTSPQERQGEEPHPSPILQPMGQYFWVLFAQGSCRHDPIQRPSPALRWVEMASARFSGKLGTTLVRSHFPPYDRVF